MSDDLRLVQSTESTLSEEEGLRLSRQLERAVQRVCPPWLADLRDDLVQVALMRVMEVRRKSEGKREFAASYLWKVAYSALVDEIRRQRRRRETPLEETGPDDGPLTPSPNPQRWTANREVGVGIRECLAEMIRPRRLAVVLYLQGHTVPEAARLLGWNHKRTENLVYRGLADLRQCLAGKGLEP